MRFYFDGVSIEICWGLDYIAPDPSWSVPYHTHAIYEGHFVMEGKGVNFLRNKEELILSQDMVYLAPPHEIHAQRSDANCPMSLYYLGFQLKFDDKRKQIPRIYSHQPFVREELKSILQLKQQATFSSKFAFQLRLMELLCKILEPVISSQNEDETINKMDTSKYYVEKAIAYTEDHLLEQPSIDEIAASCNISKRQLTRIFYKTMDMSLYDYVQHERYNWCLSQLRNTQLTIHEISDGLNFSSTQYFIQWFKKFASISPLEFRNQDNI